MCVREALNFRHRKRIIKKKYVYVSITRTPLTSDENISPIIMYGIGPQPIENIDMYSIMATSGNQSSESATRGLYFFAKK